MSNFSSQLNWRNATKKFDSQRKVSDGDLAKICEAIRMAPTSFGLQPFYIKVVKDAAVKEKLQKAGWGQVQFSSSTAAIVFVARTTIKSRIDDYFNQITGGNPEARAQMKDYESMMQGSVGQLPEESAKVWAGKQCYIALGFALAVCAELGIDSCPMEGFVPAEFDQILGLPKGEFSTVALTIGYAAPDFKPYPKFRFPEADIVRPV